MDPAPSSPGSPSPEGSEVPPYDVELADLRVSRAPGSAPGVVLVTLDLPDRRNMMSAAMTASWGRAMAGLAADPSVRAVVVTGEGTRVLLRRRRVLDRRRAGRDRRRAAQPDAAVLPDLAVGAGARGPDHRRGQRGRRSAPGWRWRWPATCGTPPRTRALSVPFTALGMHPGMATTYLLPEVAGLAVAREMLLTGPRRLTGAEAAACGLVTRAVPRRRGAGDARWRRPTRWRRPRRSRPG